MKRTVPLVRATARAREDALEFLPVGAVVESEVAQAILEGKAVFRPVPRVLGPNWTAYVRRVPGVLRTRPRAWLVLAVLEGEARETQPKKEEACRS